VKRRTFLIAFGAAVAAPLAVRAQQPERVRRVGVLVPWPENQPNTQARVTAFAQALARLGWVEGRNIRIDYRFAAGDPALFKTYATELVGRSPDVILASTPPAVVALRQQTRTIPIIFVLVVAPGGAWPRSEPRAAWRHDHGVWCQRCLDRREMASIDQGDHTKRYAGRRDL